MKGKKGLEEALREAKRRSKPLFDDDADEDNSPQIWPYQRRGHERHKIEHFLQIKSVHPSKNISRCTYSEVMDIKLKNFKQARNPDLLLERIFRALLQRLIMNNEAWGKPKFISLQINNEMMETPFFVPLRAPEVNTPEVLAAAFSWLAQQSGKRLKLFRLPLQCKIFGVWPLKSIF